MPNHSAAAVTIAFLGLPALCLLAQTQTAEDLPAISYQTPAAWQRTEAGALRFAEFEISDGAQTGDVAIMSLPPSRADNAAFVNRWRAQLGLEALAGTEQTLAKIAIDGLEADYADIVGKDDNGEHPRMLAVLLRTKDRIWMFTARGPQELLGKQKPAFEEFVRSVRLRTPDFDPTQITRLRKMGAKFEIDGAGAVVILSYMDRQTPAPLLAILKDLTGLEQLWLDRSRVDDSITAQLKDYARLRRLGLGGTRVSDAGLANLRNLQSLEAIGLTETLITDASMAQLSGLKNLFGLDVSDTAVTDAGLAHLAGLTKLRNLGLDGTKVSDRGLLHLEHCRALEELSLSRTAVTGSAFARLKELHKLKWLRLQNAPLADDALPHLQQMTQLELLTLAGTPLTDQGLAHVKHLTKLQYLDIGGTKVTDAGLAELANLKQLEQLGVYDSNVTDAGVRQLQLALPKAKIVHLLPK